MLLSWSFLAVNMPFLLILFGLFYWTLALIGLGQVFRWVLSRLKVKLPELTYGELGFLGIFLIIFLGLIIHFFSPIYPLYGILFSLLGLVVFLINFSKKQFGLKIFLNGFLTLNLIIFIVSYTTLVSEPLYDVYLYQFQTIIWQHRYALSPGLALLQFRFGFNSNWFLFSNFLVTPFAWQVGAFLANSLLLILTTIFTWEKFFMIRLQKFKIDFSHFFLFFTSLGVIWWQLLPYQNFSPITNDFPILIMIFYSIYLLIEYLNSSAKQRSSWLNLLLLVVAFSVTIKISSFSLAIMTVIILIWQTLNERRLPISWLYFGFLLSLVIFWLLRSLILSGCLLFPYAASCFPSLAWTLPLSKVKNEAKWIAAWARQPDVLFTTVLADWDWLKLSWWPGMTQSFRFVSYLVLAAVGLMASLISLLKQGWRQVWQKHRAFLIVFSFTLISLALWFFTAPDFRFGHGYIATTAILPWSYFAVKLNLKKERVLFLMRRLLQIALIIMIYHTFILFLQDKNKFETEWPIKNNANYIIDQTELGQLVYRPANRDLCFNAPLPCSSDIGSDLIYFITPQRYHFYRFKP